MAQTLISMYVHIVLHTKHTKKFIRPEIESKLFTKLENLVSEVGSKTIIMNGTANHVHLLISMSKNNQISTLIEDLKSQSSKWMKQQGDDFKNFHWQGGYGAFSICNNRLEIVIRSIENQKEHHKKVSTEEEYVQLLKENGIDFEEEYLWNT